MKIPHHLYRARSGRWPRNRCRTARRDPCRGVCIHGDRDGQRQRIV